MKPLSLAIFARFEGSALQAALTGGLHYRKADRDAQLPYGVVLFPGGHTAPSAFEVTQDSVLVQFSFFSSDSEEVDDLCQACMDLFDGCELSVAGFRAQPFEREAPPQGWPEDEGFHAVMQYRINLEKGA